MPLPPWRKWVIAVVFSSVLELYSSIAEAAIPEAAQLSYTKPGDFILGGIFPLNLEGTASCGSVPTVTTLQLTEAMVYAVESVNRREDLLPNKTLGFDIRDDCFAEDTALWAALSLINNDQCGVYEQGNLVGIVGPLTSTQSVLIGAMCDLLEVPSISFGATSDELSDKTRFEFFSRAVPPDSYQSEAIADLLHFFGWEYVSLVYFANTYGIQASHAFQNYARERDICIAVSAPIRNIQTEAELNELADALHEARKAQVVVMFVGSATANAVIRTLRSKYPSFADEITWVGSEYWGYTISLETDEILPMGGLFINFYLPTPQDFADYFVDLSFDMARGNPWMEKFFDEHTDTEMIGTYDTTSLGGLAASVMDSVLAFAHGLDVMLKECPDDSRHCESSATNFTGRDLLGLIRNNSFEGTRGTFRMNEKGDLSGKYVLKNLQMVDGKPSFVEIAIWDALNTTSKLMIHPEKIKWLRSNDVNENDEEAMQQLDQPATSSCRANCQMGFIVVPLKEKCCWGCRKCPDNAIVINNTECKECGDTEWPSEDFTTCETIVPTLLDLWNPVIATLILFSCLGVLLCVVTTVGLIMYHDHPQVKASSRELSTINILGLILGFVAVFVLLLKPTEIVCAVSHTVISLCLTLTYAPTVLKVSRIYRIFNAGLKSTRRPKWTGPKEQLILAGVLIVIQVRVLGGFEGFLIKMEFKIITLIKC